MMLSAVAIARWVVASCMLVRIADAAPCDVTVTADADQRAAIEARLRSEPYCASERYAVSITPTDDGFEVIAVDATGKRRARVVSDRERAAVLVAQWVATPIIEQQQPAKREPASRARSLGIAAFAALQTLGVRGDLDVRRGAWIGYASGSLGRVNVPVENGGERHPRHVRIAVGGGLSQQWTGWALGLRSGLSLTRWSDGVDQQRVEAVMLGFETQLALARRIAARWSVVVGLDLVSYLARHQPGDALMLRGEAVELGASTGVHWFF